MSFRSPEELRKSTQEMVKKTIHDIRNPRHAIDGLVEILLEDLEELGTQLSDSQRELIQDILGQSKRLEAVERDLLDWLERLP